MITSRRHDLDWLRVIAFTVLIFFHTAIIFIPDGLPMVQNDETSGVLLGFVEFSHLFRLSLLFLISGVGVFFARHRRTVNEFVTERSRRLLIPLAFGIVAIVPPMVYLERVHLDEFAGSLLSFYIGLPTSGVYPEGNLSWHHLWFIVYLYLYCLMGLWIFPLVTAKRWFARKFERWSGGYHVFDFIVPLFLIEVSLRALFPGIPNLVSDWANFFHFFLVFVAGYVIASDIRILERVVELRYAALFVSMLTTLILFTRFYGEAGLMIDRSSPTLLLDYVLYCACRTALIWSTLLVCLGFAGRYLNRPSRWLGYLNEAVYPLFLLHLTVITALGFVIVDWKVSLWLKYFLISTGTIVIVFAIYQFLIRPFNTMRLLFGVKPQDKAVERIARASP